MTEQEKKEKELELLELEEAEASNKPALPVGETKEERTLRRYKEANKNNISDAFVKMQANALKYLGGLTSTGVSAPISALAEYGRGQKTGGQAISTAIDDIIAAAKNNAPSGENIAERHFPKGTATKIAGPIIDIGSGLAAGQIGKTLGKFMYKTAFSDANAAAKDLGKGKNAVSDAAWRYGVTGNEDEIFSKIDNLTDKLNANRARAVDIIESSGNKVDPKNLLRAARDKVGKLLLSDDPNTVSEGQKLSGYLDELEARISGAPEVPAVTVSKQVPSAILDESGKPIIKTIEESIPATPAQLPAGGQRVQNLKSDITESIGSKAYQQLKENPLTVKVKKAVGLGAKEELERLADKAGIGDEFSGINKDLGTFLTARKALSNNATKAMKKNPLTEVDMMALGLDPTIFALKQGGKISKMSSFRTRGGKAAYDLGKALQLYSPSPSLPEGISLYEEE